MTDADHHAAAVDRAFANAAARVEEADAQLRRELTGRPVDQIIPRVLEAFEALGIHITGREKLQNYAEAISQNRPFRIELH